MNLLDTASLVVTPNGYKASKLYSIVPSDGTGDMTFARTGDTATRVNSSGLIETVLANKPRLDYLGSTCPKLLLEPQRTNIILQSQDISSASWLKNATPTIVSNASVSPDGTTTADTIKNDTGVAASIYQFFTVSANSTYTFSLFVKKATTKTHQGGVAIEFASGVTSKNLYVAFDEVNGTLTTLSTSTLTGIYNTIDLGSYWKFSITTTDNGSNTLLITSISPTFTTNGTSIGYAIGSARTIWGFQLEAGAYATSYIPTTTASVTRNADVCSKTSATALIGQTEGTMFFDGYFGNNADEIWLFLKKAGTAAVNDTIYLQKSGANKVAFNVYTGSTNQVYVEGGSYLLGSRIKIAAAYKSNSFALYVNGVQIGTDSSGTVPTCDSIYIGTYSEDPTGPTFIANKGINTTALWKTRLTNQELATLTTI